MPRLKVDFAVVSLPRSGSAWVANFLSYGDKAFCHHEYLSRRITGLDVCGDVASGVLVGNIDGIYAFGADFDLGDAPYAFLIRHPKAVLASMRRISLDDTHFELMVEKMQDLASLGRHRGAVHYNDLFSDDSALAEKSARALWDMLLPIPFDRNHWLRCHQLKVTSNQFI